MKIDRFALNDTQKSLLIEFANSDSYQLPYEYLRISSPNIKNVKGKKELICHKKQVGLYAIECVAKHGYRLMFDDSHIAIFSNDYFLQLAFEQERRWQSYLTELEQSGHSREAMIDFKQV
jgi:DUF971 family protein